MEVNQWAMQGRGLAARSFPDQRTRLRPRRIRGLHAALLLLLMVGPAQARPIRRLFEPTDLEWEKPGTAELDLQLGMIRGPDAFRLVIPDVELDIGITHEIELDVDGAFAFEGPMSGQLRYDHVAPDNLWVPLKAGLLSFQNQAHSFVTATGLQLGPKLPIARQARGLGLEGLFLLGLGFEHTHANFNLGALLDPAVGGGSRPGGYEGGVAFDQDLDNAGKWSLTGEFGAVHFFSTDRDQMHATAGIALNPSDSLTLSAVALAGLLRADDRYGLLLGVSPKMRLWGK
jgi:hypothetical protein